MHQVTKNENNNNSQCDLCKQEFATSKGLLNDKESNIAIHFKNVKTVGKCISGQPVIIDI